MTDFTRLTVIGSRKRAELVVPDDETLGGLLPRLMELLDEPSGPVGRPLTLVRVTGEQVEAGLTAAEQQLADGEQLRLVRADEAPPPPEVADVTDVVGDTFADRRGRWSAGSRYAVGAVVIGAGTAVAALSRPVPVGVLVLVVAVLALVAVAAGRLGTLPTPTAPTGAPEGRRWPVIAATAAAAGLCLPLGRELARAVTAGVPGDAALVWPVLAAALVWLVLGAGVGGGLGHRPALPAALLGAGLLAVPLALASAGLTVEHAVAVTGGVAVVALGLLPWYALTSSGLTGLDDQVLDGAPSRRSDAVRTVDDAYATLSWSAVAVALPLAGTAAVLVGSRDRWTLVLGLAVVTVTALRTRAFPLTVQQVPLCLATATGAVVAVLRHHPAFTPAERAGLLVLLVVVVAVAAGVRPAAHHRARLRRFGNLVEALAVIALVPLVLGSFGVFADLLRAFR
ncbi:hypothetical protein FHX74_001244 [Friedmanniella endophytica]|uniref:EccD-like transmembrane domain-containing protein n=1 Tax=Microlunatus kandeliicorticis TaxID=1759536 RepID=A0A7W3IQY2_9ACTN|nr:EsaB/YukD family protein [Microlunatus kandeliicorticis]MBA8793639.1 hypothetical protein [Microlunatus kandeliicorticis]